jgi:signal transduction histidine kinase
MWATPSPSTNRLLVGGWAIFAGLNVILMYLMPGQETVPFHFVWISLALVYGFTTWRTSWMIIALVGVVVTTGAILAHHAATGEIRWEETTEEPLMAAIFGVMVWHVYRRQLVLREMQRIGELERRRLERKQLFLRLASHELRTPLTVARGYTELVRAAHHDPATVEDTTVVLEELDKASGITQRMVTLMQVEEPHPRRRTDIDAQLLRIVRRWAPAAARGWRAQSSIGHAHINPERFEAAMDCLLENAVKFTGPGDDVTVRGWREPNGWAVQVADTGTGVSPASVDGLLNPPAGQDTRTGTGLGLLIVRAVLESLDGRISITGAPGEGTTVTLWIPQPLTDPQDGPAPDPAVTERFDATGLARTGYREQPGGERALV